MGKKLSRDEHDMVLSPNGESDPASRTFLVVHIERYKLVPKSNKGLHPFIDDHSKDLVIASIDQFNGRLLENDPDYCLVGVFSSSLDAIGCAQNIREILLKKSKSAKGNGKTNLHLRLGINCGPPLSDSKGFFEETLINTKRQGIIAKPGQIILSSNLRNAYELNTKKPLIPDGIRILTKSEEIFLRELFDSIEQDMHPSKCNVNLLSEQLRISRSQLYRQILTLTGESPNYLLKELRMNKAWILLRSKEGNILQIALEVGYSNPSHFSKIFRERFGYLPSVLQI
jgi:AraC-like DNA-binding protein